MEDRELRIKECAACHPRVTVLALIDGEGGEHLIQSFFMHQTLSPVEIVPLRHPTADMIRTAAERANGDVLMAVTESVRFKSKYDFEKRILTFVLDPEGVEKRIAPIERTEALIFRKGNLADGAAELLACPNHLAWRNMMFLPDCERQRFADVIEAVKARDLRLINGKVLPLIAKASIQFQMEGDQRFLSRCLHEIEYYRNREFLTDADWNDLRKELDALYNVSFEDVVWPGRQIPRIKPVSRCEKPLITYIVPVCNQEQYLTCCLESLRNQTLREIEIICVDDGSVDGSLDILAEYARRDGRITVIHQENAGVGVARNRALDIARGKYVSFVDGDDWLDPQAAEISVGIAERYSLDFCSYDISAYDHNTRQPITIFWSLSNQAHSIPVNRVTSMKEFDHLLINASACLATYNLDFIRRTGFHFSSLKLGEDFMFTLILWPKAKRFYCLTRKLYHYRRGQPGSAISNLTAGVGSKQADDAQIKMMTSLLSLYTDVYLKQYDDKLIKLFRGRVLADILYYAERSLAVRKWLHETGWRGFGFDNMRQDEFGDDGFHRRWQAMGARLGRENYKVGAALPTPIFGFKARLLTLWIECARKNSKKDLYLVTGQLNSRTNEPIDSWSFFSWLQQHGVPSRYVIWKEHPFYARLVTEGRTKDVIALDGDGVADDEFLFKCRAELIRSRAVVQENSALNPNVRTWLKNLKDCAYVFLQHGVFYTWFTPVAGKTLALFNYVNVASTRERDFILERAHNEHLGPDNFIIGGLPRWDLLVDDANHGNGEKIVLVMLTWRMSFGQGMERIKKSAYYHQLRRFLSGENVQRLKNRGIKIVLALHHYLTNHVDQLDFDVSVEIAASDAISYWIRKANMLVTDFSSVSIDFLYQNKPTVFWMLDSNDMLLDRADTDDGGKVLSALHEVKAIYNQVFYVEEVMEKIEYYADTDFVLEPEKRRIAEAMFSDKHDISRHLYDGVEAKLDQVRLEK